MLRRVVCLAGAPQRCFGTLGNRLMNDRDFVSEMKSSVLSAGVPPISPGMDRPPSDSFTQKVLPFSNDRSLREQYVSFTGLMRLGRFDGPPS